MDIIDSINGHSTEYFASKYPGFPRFVHEIMYLVEHGKTPEEAATLSCEGLRERVTSVIEEVNSTHAYLDESGNFVLPENIANMIENGAVGTAEPAAQEDFSDAK